MILKGGAILNVTGTCFTSDTTVTLDGIACRTLNVSYSSITCVIPPNVKLKKNFSKYFKH